MTDRTEAMENLFQAIDIITQERLSNLGYDKTIKATIVDDSKAAQGTYELEYGANNIFTAHCDASIIYKTGMVVYVIIPQGDWNNDKLIIGKFCQIASGVEFVMNGANHQMNAVSTFPFYTLEGWNQPPPTQNDLPIKGDTIIGNDVWIGQNATILPGVHIGDGAIIGANSVVGSDVQAYTVVVGNPARPIRKRFDEELIEIMEKLKWWDKSIEEINNLIPLLANSNLEYVKEELKKLL